MTGLPSRSYHSLIQAISIIMSSGYQHIVIRLQRENGEIIPYEESLKLAESFAKHWRQDQRKTENYGGVFFHVYKKEEVTFARVNHLHIVYKPYKASKAKFFIESFASEENLRLYRSDVKYLFGLRKYLLQGNGRILLCETGIQPQEGLHSGDQLVWSKAEAVRCENNVWEEHDEEVERADISNPGSSVGASSSRAAGKVCKARKMEAIKDIQWLKETILKYRIKDETMLLRKMTEDEKLIFNATMFEHGTHWTKVWIQAKDQAITSLMDMKWEDIIRTLPDDTSEYSVPVMGRNKSLKIFTKILQAQGWGTVQRKHLLQNIYAVMNNNIKRHKRNTLYFHGKTSAGKTLIATSLALSKIFAYTAGDYNPRSGDFFWEDLAWATLFVVNEPQIEAGKVDFWKIVLEGGAMDVNVKFKSKHRVEGVPCIVTTNNEIWRYALEAQEPFEERIYRWDFKQKISGMDINGNLHPKMWLDLIEYYQLDKPEDDDSSDSDFDISEFGGKAVRKFDMVKDGYEQPNAAIVHSSQHRRRNIDNLESVADVTEVERVWRDNQLDLYLSDAPDNTRPFGGSFVWENESNDQCAELFIIDIGPEQAGEYSVRHAFATLWKLCGGIRRIFEQWYSGAFLTNLFRPSLKPGGRMEADFVKLCELQPVVTYTDYITIWRPGATSESIRLVSTMYFQQRVCKYFEAMYQFICEHQEELHKLYGDQLKALGCYCQLAKKEAKIMQDATKQAGFEVTGQETFELAGECGSGKRGADKTNSSQEQSPKRRCVAGETSRSGIQIVFQGLQTAPPYQTAYARLKEEVEDWINKATNEKFKIFLCGCGFIIYPFAGGSVWYPERHALHTEIGNWIGPDDFDEWIGEYEVHECGIIFDGTRQAA